MAALPYDNYSKGRNFQSRLSRHSVYSLIIAGLVVVVVSMFVGHNATGAIDLPSLLFAQKTSKLLWVLDAIFLVFVLLRCYAGSRTVSNDRISREVRTEREFRRHTAALGNRITRDANHDTLTGLPNRFLLLDRVGQAIRSAERTKKHVVLNFIGIKGFKELNDNQGHAFGDELLLQVSARLENAIRRSDTLARVGGDEFVILLGDVSAKEDVSKVAQNIHQSLAAQIPVQEHKLDVQAVVGSAIYPDHGKDKVELLQRADVAMYFAMQENKDFILYESSIDQHSTRRMAMMNELRQAIEQDVLELYYQPKIGSKSNKVEAVEALVRWNHPEHGFMAPDEFIPLAECTGLVTLLSQWVLRTAICQMASWVKECVDLQVSVNISAQDLQLSTLPETIKKLLVEHNVRPSHLILEVSETTIMGDKDLAMETLSRFGDLGVFCSIDNFGTGCSSLPFIKRLPATELKIDKSFVITMISDLNDADIVQSIIALAHKLGLKVVAEGVESDPHVALLREWNCDFFQGYGLGRPMPADVFVQWYNESQWKRDEVFPGRGNSSG